MSDETLAEIVALHPDRDLTDEDAPLHQEPKGYVCTHKTIRLDQTAHKAFCRQCDKEVDLFDYVWRLAGNWSVWVRHRKEAKRRAHEAQTRLDETLRLERNARARVKRRDPDVKLPAIPWGEGGTR